MRRTSVFIGTGFAVAVAVALGLQAVSSETGVPDFDTQTRHTISAATYLARVDAQASVWASISLTREIWIGPDGSGRIAEEHGPLSFPSASEREEWLSAGRPSGPMPIRADFAAGELKYWSLNAVPLDPTLLQRSLTEGDPTGGEVLKRISSLLFETAPPPEVNDTVISAARMISAISIDSAGSKLTMRGDLGDESLTIIYLDFDAKTHRLVGERHVATGPIEWLDHADRPIVMLESTIRLSERLPSGSLAP